MISQLQKPLCPISSWYAPLATIRSLGSQSARPGSLAGLHEARKEHLSQFFTPLDLSRFMWSLVEPAIAVADRRVSVLDNAVGSGRLLAFADPEKHAIYGVDVHAASIDALREAAEAAKFPCDFRACGMEQINPRNFDIAFINPPFSIQLSDPALIAYPCTSHGKYGPGTSAVSHAYALHQALDAAHVVVAILPATYADEVASDPDMTRLLADITLPPSAFREEGTEVSTRVLVFGPEKRRPVLRVRLTSLAETVALPRLAIPEQWGKVALAQRGIDDSEPAITLPVTGDNRVQVAHDGRRIKLKFFCGLVQARVSNSLMKQRVEEFAGLEIRRPRGVRYTGQGVLDLEVHLLQADPQASFRDFLRQIAVVGGFPVVDAGLRNFLAKRIKQVAREKTALRHTVFVPQGKAGNNARITGTARKRHLAAKVFGAPLIQAGQAVEFDQLPDGRYHYALSGQDFTLSSEELYERFEATQGAASAGWHVAHEGLRVTFPEDAARWTGRARALGLHKWLTWDFQLEDAVELIMNGSAVAAWNMGLGKARLASALVLLSGVRRGLICVEAHLIPEMERELSGLPIPAAEWKVIRAPGDLDCLTRINIISYERLRMPVTEGNRVKDSYAGRLRRRIGCLVADEGHLLANANSQQSRALWHLSAKRRFILTGTPAPNYPRDIHPLLVFTGGDATVAQPYGLHRGYLEENWRQSMSHAVRGIDKFREDFVVMEWCTNEFAEDNRSGAKREIPRLANLDKYRALLAPWVKRRLTLEPDVARYIKIPIPTRRITEVEWDENHLAHYLLVCEEFTQWYRKERGEGQRINLIALLARIQAVQFAANFPQHNGKHSRIYSPLTSKQRFAVERLAELTAGGHKTILFADSPDLIEMLAGGLRRQHGIDPVVFHGGIQITRRTQELDNRFRFGDSPILLATLGTCQAGLNLPQADTALFYNRSWSAKTEAQALARMLRPQQTQDVLAEYLMLPGSIDDYQGQMVAAKADTMQAGLDWGTPELDDVEFLHLDTLIGKFTESYAANLGVHRQDLRKYLEGEVWRKAA